MKKHAFKPGFEFIFSLCILTVLGLPPLVFAQTTKDLQITINNGDTTVNGKNIKDISAGERKDALKNISQITVISSGDNNVNSGQPPMIANDGRHGRHQRIIMLDGNGKDSAMVFNYKTGDEPRHKILKYDYRFNRDDDSRMEFDRRNTQNFVYNNIDNNGVSTRVSYLVSDHPAMLDYDAGKQGETQMDMLSLTDLNIAPRFSEGKTVLMFNLPGKAAADVQFKDSNGTLLWSAKAMNGEFSKSFPLGLNGSYYLQVKQGSKVAVKKIDKE